MKNLKKNNSRLYTWCLEQVSERYIGELKEYQIDLLNKEEFPWVFYATDLHSMGFCWDKNLPKNPSDFAINLRDIFIDKPRTITYEELYKEMNDKEVESGVKEISNAN